MIDPNLTCQLQWWIRRYLLLIAGHVFIVQSGGVSSLQLQESTLPAVMFV